MGPAFLTVENLALYIELCMVQKFLLKIMATSFYNLIYTLIVPAQVIIETP